MPTIASRTYQIALEQIKHHRLTIAIAVFITLIATVLEVLSPLLFSYLIDNALTARNIEMILPILLAIVLIPIVTSGLHFAEGHLRSKIGIAVTQTLRQKAFQHILSARLFELEQCDTGELFQRLTRTCGEIGDVFVQDSLLPLIPRIILLLGNIIAMFVASWRLAAVAMIAVPLLFVFGQLFRKWVELLDERLYAILDADSSMIHETLAGIRTIRAFNGQAHETARWQRWDQHYKKTKLKSGTLHTFWIDTLATFLTNVVLAVVLGFGAFEVINNHLSLGGLIAFIIYAPRVLSALQVLTRTQLSLATVKVATAKLDTYFALPLERSNGESLPSTTDNRTGVKVVFEDVSFRYGRGNAGVNHLSLQIQPGEFVGIVGSSGSGKSTIFDLLMGFYEPDSGRILLNNVDMRQLALPAIRQAVGVVFQDEFLWNTSLQKNLVYPRESLEVGATLQAAIRTAQLDTFIAELPDGLETEVGEGGHSLSGGERQRVAIARAVLRNPRLLLFDEATSGLDSITEEKLKHSLESLRKGRTTIVIAHRLATITQADRVIVIDKGQVVEQGSPNDLLKQEGLFYAFYQAQKLELHTERCK